MGNLHIPHSVGATLGDGDDVVKSHFGLLDASSADGADPVVSRENKIAINPLSRVSAQSGASTVLHVPGYLFGAFGMGKRPRLKLGGVVWIVARALAGCGSTLFRLGPRAIPRSNDIAVTPTVISSSSAVLFWIGTRPRLSGGTRARTVGVIPGLRAAPCLFAMCGGIGAVLFASFFQVRQAVRALVLAIVGALMRPPILAVVSVYLLAVGLSVATASFFFRITGLDHGTDCIANRAVCSSP